MERDSFFSILAASLGIAAAFAIHRYREGRRTTITDTLGRELHVLCQVWQSDVPAELVTSYRADAAFGVPGMVARASRLLLRDGALVYSSAPLAPFRALERSMSGRSWRAGTSSRCVRQV
jgi:hypothetical protein